MLFIWSTLWTELRFHLIYVKMKVKQSAEGDMFTKFWQSKTRSVIWRQAFPIVCFVEIKGISTSLQNKNFLSALRFFSIGLRWSFRFIHIVVMNADGNKKWDNLSKNSLWRCQFVSDFLVTACLACTNGINSWQDNISRHSRLLLRAIIFPVLLLEKSIVHIRWHLVRLNIIPLYGNNCARNFGNNLG